MKKCPKCSAIADDASNFCESCGTNLSDVSVMEEISEPSFEKLSNDTNKAGRSASNSKNTGEKTVFSSTGGWDSAINTGNRSGSGQTPPSENTSSLFIDQNESAVATIGSNYLQSYLTDSTVSEGFSILTQKRFYYKGKNFGGGNLKQIKSTTEEGVVSISDITFTKFIYVRHTGLLIFAFLMLIIASFTYYLGYRSDFMLYSSGLAIVAGIVSFIIYFIKRQTLFLVAFPGGGFSLNIKWYPISDIRDFQRQLHLLKDHIKEEVAR